MKIDFQVGDTVAVHTRDLTDEKTPVYVFTGTILAFKGRGKNRTMTVRKIGAGKVGIERIFPLKSPTMVKAEVKKKGKARRAKLYYLRDQSGALRKILRRGTKKETQKKAKSTGKETSSK